MIGTIVRTCILAFVMAVATFHIAGAGTLYDGSWSLSIVTQRGGCDPNYSFQVQVTNGIVSHPNLVRLRGRVSSGGSLAFRFPSRTSTRPSRANCPARRAADAGGGYSGADRCSGYWIAQRN